jgi:integrase
MRSSASNGESPHVPRNREREYLRPDEANRLIIAAGKRGRNPLRDVVLTRLLYRHGLRCSEARLARWSQFDLDSAGTKTFMVKRLKGSDDACHTLDRDEVAGLRKLREVADSPYVFVSERGGPMSADMVARVVAEAGEAAGIPFHVYPHALRHSTGYALANQGTDTLLIQAHLGHRDIRNTVNTPRCRRSAWRASGCGERINLFPAEAATETAFLISAIARYGRDMPRL